MGNTSSKTYRRVQPSLVHTFKYNRLLSSSRSDHSQQPLLVDNHHQNVEQLKLENETNQRKKESLEKQNAILEKQNAILEKDMRDFKAAITSKKELDSGMENKVAALEKQVAELKTTISMLKSVSCKPVTPDVEQLKRETETNRKKNKSEKKNANLENDIFEFKVTVGSEKNPDSDMGWVAALEKQVGDLKSDIPKLKSTSSQTVTPKLNKDTLAQKIVELEKQLLELTPTHKTTPTLSAESDSLVTLTEQEFGNPVHDLTNDLAGYLVVLIFLVAILVGLNM